MSSRRRTKIELRDNGECFRQAFLHSPIGMAVVSHEGKWLQVNRALCRLIGYTGKQLLKTDFHSLTHLDDFAEDVRMTRRLLTGKTRSAEWEKRYLHKRGHEVWVSLSVAVLGREQKSPRYFIVQVQDITKRKHAVDQLQIMSKVFKDSSDSILIEDLSGCIIDLNRSTELYYGWKRAQLIGQPIKMIIPHERHEQADELLARCKRGETVRDIETTRWTKTGKSLPVLVTLSPLLNNEGETVAIASIAKDISALKDAEAALEKKESPLQLLQEITALANEADSLESAMQQAIDLVCRYTGWCIGHVYILSERSLDTLTSAKLWYLEEDSRYSPFRVRTEKLVALPKEELACQVLMSGEPSWP